MKINMVIASLVLCSALGGRVVSAQGLEERVMAPIPSAGIMCEERYQALTGAYEELRGLAAEQSAQIALRDAQLLETTTIVTRLRAEARETERTLELREREIRRLENQVSNLSIRKTVFDVKLGVKKLVRLARKGAIDRPLLRKKIRAQRLALDAAVDYNNATMSEFGFPLAQGGIAGR